MAEYTVNGVTISTTAHGPSLYPKTSWSAIEPDTYDGAPDAQPPSNCIGYGDTEVEAVIDLFTQLQEAFA